jgi:DNA-binding response OmpR family regulator
VAQTRKKRILMVEDEQDINITIKTVLEDTGSFQVDTFNDAESALSLFGPDRYDLAPLDIRMPGMSGFQLCRKLREMDKELKICFLTATELLYFRDTDSDVIDDLGTHCFVAKPVNTIDLIDRLKVILSRNDR